MKRVATSILIPLFFLAACGSGDSTFNGQNDNDQNEPPPITGLAIDANNALEVSSAAYAAAIGSGELADLVGATGLTATKTGGSSKPLRIVKTIAAGSNKQPPGRDRAENTAWN
jgi:hypothetical protein